MNDRRQLIVALGRRMLFDLSRVWHAAIAEGEVLPYQERYRRANPLMGAALKFVDTPEYSRALESMRTAEAQVTHCASHS
jgi:hypothetical protein